MNDVHIYKYILQLLQIGLQTVFCCREFLVKINLWCKSNKINTTKFCKLLEKRFFHFVYYKHKCYSDLKSDIANRSNLFSSKWIVMLYLSEKPKPVVRVVQERNGVSKFITVQGKHNIWWKFSRARFGTSDYSKVYSHPELCFMNKY